ncbi:hypothetical protein OI69_02325 [Pectobacterium fontis]|uniref:Uncharacterized protein n=1 Tax=Pectobacterium fontis TaxID=2558042 RepID=A0A7V8L7K2_9GAMM|nr:hypothetical protein OI69_02325 [Pectobacterium fontis]
MCESPLMDHPSPRPCLRIIARIHFNKKFTRRLDKLEKDRLIAFEGERITPLSQRNQVGDSLLMFYSADTH